MGKKEKISLLLFYKSEISKRVRNVYKLRHACWDSMIAHLRHYLIEITHLCVKSSEVKGVYKKHIRCFDTIKARLDKVEKVLNFIDDLDESLTKEVKSEKFDKYMQENWY